MKILQINKYHYLRGGPETVYFNTCKLLTEHGHSVVHFSMKNEQDLESPTREFFPESFELRNGSFFEKLRKSFRFFYNREAKKKLEQLIVQEKPDVAQIHLYNNSLSVSIFTILKKYNIPVVLILHDHRSLCPSSLFLSKGKLCEKCKKSLYLNCTFHKCFQKNLLHSFMLTLEIWQREFFFKLDKYVDEYLFISKFQREMHFSYHTYYEAKSNRQYNFIPEIEQIKPSATRGNYYLFVGGIVEAKGIVTLVETARKMNNYLFKVAGTGPLLEELRKTAPDNVEFLGFKTGTELENLIRNSFFTMTLSEGVENSPMTIIESYSHGKPCIACRIGGIPELVIDNETGFLVETKSVDDLMEKIKYTQTLSDEEYMRMSLNARNFAENSFNPEQYYQSLMVLYNKAINKKRS